MGKGIIRKISLVLILISCFTIYYFSYDKNKGLRVVEWSNYYNEGNIQLYYEPIKNNVIDKRLIELKKTYKLNELVNNNLSEIDKIMKLIEITNNIVVYDGVPSSLNVNGYDILKENGERKKVSERDMAIIARDLIVSYGYEARVGEFRKKNPQFKENPSYYVVEYWSSELNKWVMVDFKNKGYIKSGETNISSIELISKQYKKIEFVGSIKNKDFIENIKPYLASYSIAIDNTLNKKKSNSYITYTDSISSVDMKLYGGVFIEPTIYTEDVILFQNSPWSSVEDKDDKAYIILKKKGEKATELTEEQKIKSLNTFVIAAFKDSSTIKNYYISINDGQYEEVENYMDYQFIKGKNKIKISLDGKSDCSEIIIVRHE
ncbi:MAG: hypothetical protein ACRC7N_12290 [Clostridium sp.]